MVQLTLRYELPEDTNIQIQIRRFRSKRSMHFDLTSIFLSPLLVVASFWILKKSKDQRKIIMSTYETHSGVVIQIHSLCNIPDLDDGLRKDDVSDPFLTLQILTDNGEPCGEKQTTMVFDDVHDAIFGECYHTFCTPDNNPEGAVLRIKAYDKDDMSKDDKIAHLDIKLADLTKTNYAHTMKLKDPIEFQDRVFQTRKMEMDTKRRGRIKDQPVSINLRLVPKNELARGSTTKRFFLIRHGESLWNEAQDDNNVKGMLKFDHPLNGVGIEQCKALNAAWREAAFDALTPPEKEFIDCPVILCSPLTRCVQTALLSLHSHKTLRTNGMTITRNLREVKSTLGSLDTLGIEVGPENIKNRARDTLLRVCSKAKNIEKKESKRNLIMKRASLLGGGKKEKKQDNGQQPPPPPPLTAEGIRTRIDPIKLRSNDVMSKWWTKASTYDDEKNLRARMDALMGTLRYMRSGSAILVGHSLFFRAIMRFFLSDHDLDLAADGGPTREELAARKMNNAAVAAIDVVFPAFPAERNFFRISRVSFLFGSGLEAKHEQ